MLENSAYRATSSSSFEEVDLSTHLMMLKINPIIHLLERLVEQQERIIRLTQPITPKKAGTTLGRTCVILKDRLPEETRIRRLKLYRAALDNDWEAARCIYNVYKVDIQAKISVGGDTTLHIAAAAKNTNFAKELLKIVNKRHLGRTNYAGNTALFLAAASGNVELVTEMMGINKAVAMIEDYHKRLPIHMAASSGDKYVAQQLLKDQPDIAIAHDGNYHTALHVIARKNLPFSKLANRRQRGIFKRYFDLDATDEENEKLKQVHELVKCIWQRIILLSDSEISHIIAAPGKLIFDVAKTGNIDFLSILINEHPDLIWTVDGPKNRYSLFHIAVKHRQEDVFKLIYKIGSRKENLLMLRDEEDNNILHLAAILAPQDRLNVVSGDALQFQRESMWFKEVEKVVPKSFGEARNKYGFTPRALFLQQHKELREKGEKWMKETANTCIVVATLIAAVAFTAALTVPGGNNQDTGFPIFNGKVSFQVFVISDAISLVCSLTSMETFLNIIISRYAEEDLVWRLPRKFYIGMLLLLMSMATLVVVFSTIFFVSFINNLWIAILVAVVFPTPLYMFLLRNIYQLSFGVLYMICGLQSPFR
ncbi:Ankyrin repeat family protein [Melia azedarach]|uniref:Ankyrin repeat family protein n=1 Tax=Melia azedarach TaxID=155640 RepID=A0ACC1WTD6_MELAZ|nr:Ankyrin repeat family protein [Melia azedarach]